MSFGLLIPESKSNLTPRLIGAGDEVSGSPVRRWKTIEVAELKDFLNAFFLFELGTDSSSSSSSARLFSTRSPAPSNLDQSNSKLSKLISSGSRRGPRPLRGEVSDTQRGLWR